MHLFRFTFLVGPMARVSLTTELQAHYQEAYALETPHIKSTIPKQKQPVTNLVHH